MSDNFYNMSTEETARALGADAERGLSDKEAAKRLKENGANVLKEKRKKSVSGVKLKTSSNQLVAELRKFGTNSLVLKKKRWKTNLA